VEIPDEHIQGHIAALRAYDAFPTGNIHLVLEMGQMALSLLPADDKMRSSAAIVLGAAYWASGDVIQAERSFRTAREAALKISTVRASPATCYIGLQQIKQGRLQDAMATFQDGLRMATLPNGSETFLAGFANIRLGDMYREQNDLGLASYQPGCEAIRSFGTGGCPYGRVCLSRALPIVDGRSGQSI
jgi:LuxR family maltose regulon positive regulatory protein